MPFFLLIPLYMLLEIVCLIQFGVLAGPWWTLGFLALSFLAGALLLYRARLAIGSPQSSLGLLLSLPAAFLFMLPGFFSTLAAIILLLPGLRSRLFKAARGRFPGRAGLFSFTSRFASGWREAEHPGRHGGERPRRVRRPDEDSIIDVTPTKEDV